MLDLSDWADPRSSPILRLDRAPVEIAFQPISVDTGPGPAIVQFRVRLAIQHSMDGSVGYTAHDLRFTRTAFLDLTGAVRGLLDGSNDVASLDSTGLELSVRIRQRGDGLWVRLEVVEWQGDGVADTTIDAELPLWSKDEAHSWIAVIHDYADRLDEWVISQGR